MFIILFKLKILLDIILLLLCKNIGKYFKETKISIIETIFFFLLIYNIANNMITTKLMTILK